MITAEIIHKEDENDILIIYEDGKEIMRFEAVDAMGYAEIHGPF